MPAHCEAKPDLIPKGGSYALQLSSAVRCTPASLCTTGWSSHLQRLTSRGDWIYPSPATQGIFMQLFSKMYIFFFASVKCNCGKIWKCFLLFHRKDPVLQRSPAGQPSAAVGTFMKRGQGRRRESYTPAAEWGLGLPSTLLPKMLNGSFTSSIFTSLGWKWGTPLKIKGWTIAPNRLCIFTTMHAFLPS